MESIIITEKRKRNQYENMKMQQWSAFRFRIIQIADNFIMVFPWPFIITVSIRETVTIRIELIAMAAAFPLLLVSIWTD